jgi:hypothetical protein
MRWLPDANDRSCRGHGSRARERWSAGHDGGPGRDSRPDVRHGCEHKVAGGQTCGGSFGPRGRGRGRGLGRRPCLIERERRSGRRGGWRPAPMARQPRHQHNQCARYEQDAHPDGRSLPRPSRRRGSRWRRPPRTRSQRSGPRPFAKGPGPFAHRRRNRSASRPRGGSRRRGGRCTGRPGRSPWRHGRLAGRHGRAGRRRGGSGGRHRGSGRRPVREAGARQKVRSPQIGPRPAGEATHERLQRRREIVRAGEPVLGFPLEATLHDRDDGRRYVGPQYAQRLGRLAHDLEAQLRHGFRFERPPAGQKLEENDPECPDVDPPVDVAGGPHLFRRHVKRRSKHGARAGQARAAATGQPDGLRHAEVEHLELG